MQQDVQYANCVSPIVIYMLKFNMLVAAILFGLAGLIILALRLDRSERLRTGVKDDAWHLFGASRTCRDFASRFAKSQFQLVPFGLNSIAYLLETLLHGLARYQEAKQ
jgi:hypothetical protein